MVFQDAPITESGDVDNAKFKGWYLVVSPLSWHESTQFYVASHDLGKRWSNYEISTAFSTSTGYKGIQCSASSFNSFQ